jgi:endoglucanase
MMLRRSFLLTIAANNGLTDKISASTSDWSWTILWNAYRDRFIDQQGRVIDFSENDGITTSEGQAYALFFSLVDNDRLLFKKILSWTDVNLASGQLGRKLPAWKWGRQTAQHWGILGTNSAADADAWLAYALALAGMRWHHHEYTSLAIDLARTIIEQETANTPIGRILLPGADYFPRRSPVLVNPSYTPLFLARGLATIIGNHDWADLADAVAPMIGASTMYGFAPDWAWLPKTPSHPAGFPGTKIGSYNAIRCYLWASMNPPTMQDAPDILAHLTGMAGIMKQRAVPPINVIVASGKCQGNASAGFSGALIPYLQRLGIGPALTRQLARVRHALNSDGRLPGPSAYYAENLILFGIGAFTGRIRFDREGILID